MKLLAFGKVGKHEKTDLNCRLTGYLTALYDGQHMKRHRESVAFTTNSGISIKNNIHAIAALCFCFSLIRFIPVVDGCCQLPTNIRVCAVLCNTYC